VQCRIDSDIYLSEGLTSDSGVWYAPGISLLWDLFPKNLEIYKII